MSGEKFNHRRFLRDIRSGDDDICIFALRNAMQLSPHSLSREDAALSGMIEAVEELLPTWAPEVRFYGQRALEHLQGLSRPTESDDELDEEQAEVDSADLRDPDIQVVIKCCRRIEAQEYKEARPDLLACLETAKDPLVASSIISALGVVGQSCDVFVLKRYVSHANARVRSVLVDALARLATDPTIAETMILPFLDDPDGVVACRAIRFIGEKDVQRILPVAEKISSSTDAVQRAALAQVLCSLRSEHVVPCLKKLADDTDDTVRLKLIESMERTEHPQKAFLLKKLVKDPSPNVKTVAREALRRYETKRMLAMGGFQSQLPQDLPAAKRMQALEEIQDNEELDPIVLDDLKDSDPAVRLVCLHKIRQRQYEPALRTVVGLLGTEEGEDILAAALGCLTVIGSGMDVETVMHFLGHSAGSVRVAAVRAVEQLASKSQALFLVMPMLYDENEEVQGVVGRILQKHSVDEILAHADAMARHTAPVVKYRFLLLMKHFGGELVWRFLVAASRDSLPRIRAAVVGCLLFQSGERVDQLLHSFSDDPDERVRSEASRVKSVRARWRAERREEVVLPDLKSILSVAQSFEERQRQREQEVRVAADKDGSGRPSLPEGGGGEWQGTSVRAFVGRMSQDLGRAKELENLELNRRVILEDLGKKLYGMIKSRQVANPAFDKHVFLIDKYTHLQKHGDEDSRGDRGLWARIQKAAGVERESDHARRVRETLRRGFVDLGQLALELSQRENLIYPELHMEYLELETVEKRISEFQSTDHKTQ